MLVINNNYAQRTISNTGSSGFVTLAATFRTLATIPDGGILAIGNNAQNLYTGIRIASGNLEAGMRTATGTPAIVMALSPNTLYTVVLTRDDVGNISVTVNGGTAVTKTVTVNGVSYNYESVGSYRGSAWTLTTQLKIAHTAVWRRTLSTEEIGYYHAKNFAAISTDSLLDYHSLVSNLDSNSGGTALTFVDAESDPPQFDDVDPFASDYSITNINTGNSLIPNTSSTWTTNGFATSVNAGTLDGVSLSSVSSTGFTVPNYVDEGKSVRPGTRVITATNGTQSANANVPVGVISGYTFVQLTGVDTGPYNVLTGMDAEIGDYIVYPNANDNQIDSFGRIKTNLEGSQIFWLIKGDDGYSLRYNVITGEGENGEEPPVVVSVKRAPISLSLGLGLSF